MARTEAYSVEMSKYPALRLAALSALVELQKDLAADPKFLEHEECPYDNDTKEVLRALITPRTVEVTVEKVVTTGAAPGRGRPSKDVKLSEEDQQTILDGIKKTLKELDELGIDGAEINEKVQIAKTRTALLGELLKMQERHYSISKTQEFIETVIGILEDLCDEKTRETFMSRIEAYR